MSHLCWIFTVIIAVITWDFPVISLDNGMFLTPPMGWLSWQRFRCNIDCKTDPDQCISENLYKRMADIMVRDGWKDAGYNWINIDDCWDDIKGRDPNTGKLLADPVRFPSGIKALADYIHSKGLKLGLYSDVGATTCALYPASMGHYELDAQTFAEWEIDSLKFDGCNLAVNILDNAFEEMSKAMNKTNRAMGFICVYGPYTFGKFDHLKARSHCNQWRVYMDVQDDYNSLNSIIDFMYTTQNQSIAAAGPGGWNDPDMLLLGNFGLSKNQEKLQFVVWCITASPLLMGNDLRSVSEESKKILMNREIIAINQDPLGIQGRRLFERNNVEVWTRPLVNGDLAVAFTYRSSELGFPFQHHVSFQDLGWNASNTLVRDLFAKTNLGTFKSGFEVEIEPFSASLYRLSRTTEDSVQSDTRTPSEKKLYQEMKSGQTSLFVVSFALLAIGSMIAIYRVKKRTSNYQKIPLI